MFLTVDIIYVGAANIVHKPLCKLFIEAKKNVLCEIPIAMNRNEAQEMINLARDNNVFFMEVSLNSF